MRRPGYKLVAWIDSVFGRRLLAGQGSSIDTPRFQAPTASASVAPEVLEARGRQLGVAHGVLDVSMAKVRLQCARVGALVGKLKTARVPEHVLRLAADC